MANEMLQEHIIVSVNVEKADFSHSSPYPQLFAVPEKVINWKLKRAETTLAPNIGRELAQRNQKAQKAGIVSLDAVCTGNLFGSISIKGGRGTKRVHYEVGTNIRKQYPQAVVFGRPAATAHGRAMKFKYKCDGDWLFRKRVKASTRKNYLHEARAMFEPQISGVVEREVQRVLGN